VWRVAVGTSVPIAYTSGRIAGSGTYIRCTKDWSFILTAHHVVDELPMLAGGQHIVIIKAMPELDLAVLASPLPCKLPAKVSRFNPSVGEPVWTAGHPAGYKQKRSYTGHIASIHKDGKRWLICHDAVAIAGSSGSGIFNEFGRLVGVHSTGARIYRRIPVHGFGCAVHTSHIRKIMEGL
jgi:S1-C subfamily serine protease